MKMITKEIERELMRHPICSQDGLMGDAKLIVKFFDPSSAWTWYVTEGEPFGNDWRFFGLVRGDEWEWGYFMLSQIMEARGHVSIMTPAGMVTYGGIMMERDMWIKPGKRTLADVVREDCGSDAPENLLVLRCEYTEEEVTASAEGRAKIETAEWTPGQHSGQQVLF